MPWQPRLRALCVLEYFSRKGDVGKDISTIIARRASASIRRLIEVPECQREAQVVHALLGEEASLDENGAHKKGRQRTLLGEKKALNVNHAHKQKSQIINVDTVDLLQLNDVNAERKQATTKC